MAKLEHISPKGMLKNLAFSQGIVIPAGVWTARAGKLKSPPTVTTAIVSKLANPDYLIEIEALAVLS